MGNTVLETKLVGDISGNFVIPSYQRGYRWGKGETEKSLGEVERLLEDIYTFGKDNSDGYYCLQPVVVLKREDGKFELIDGQQRLTTIYLIYHYIHEKDSSINMPEYSISYGSRDKSKDFLEKINLSDDDIKTEKDKNIDFWYFYTAYELIDKWFNTHKDSDGNPVFSKIDNLFKEKVQVIWYEVDSSENPIELFTRLNIGKIPLTNAELVKAMFLSRDNGENFSMEKRQEIALQWDLVEKELHDDMLWYFLTNKTDKDYQTRIDLVLDIIANTPADNREKYHTFYEFNKKHQNNQKLDDIWLEIQQTFLELKSWYTDRDLYHMIGYLIAVNSASLQDLYNESQNRTKTAFNDYLKGLIKKSIKINLNETKDNLVNSSNVDGYLKVLNYESDHNEIENLLLLFNIETIRKSINESQRFPFDKYKVDKDGARVKWTLEHIHAQNSQSLKKAEQWQEWFEHHITAVKNIAKDMNRTLSDGSTIQKLVDDMNEAEEEAKKGKLSGNLLSEFTAISDRVFKAWAELENDGNNTNTAVADPEHSISNLALLIHGDNSSIGNNVFDVKRDEIIKMHKKDHYIPVCTMWAFLKYYTPSDKNQVHFWGAADRKAYFNAISDTLKEYL